MVKNPIMPPRTAPLFIGGTTPTIPQYFSFPPHRFRRRTKTPRPSSPRPRRPYLLLSPPPPQPAPERPRRRDVAPGHGDLGGAAGPAASLGSRRGGRRRRGRGRRGRGRGGGVGHDDLERAARGAVVVPVVDAEDVGQPPRAAVRGRQPRGGRHRPGRQQALVLAAARRGQGGPPARPPRGGGRGGAPAHRWHWRGGGGEGGVPGGYSAPSAAARPRKTPPRLHVPLHGGRVAVAVPAEIGPRRRARQAAVLRDALHRRDRGGRVRAHRRPPAPPPPPPAPRRAEAARYATPRRVAIGDHRGVLPGAGRSLTFNQRQPPTSNANSPITIPPSSVAAIVSLSSID